MMLSNNLLKLISILLAIIVWFIVATSEQQETSFYVPVKFKNEMEGLKAFTDTNLVSVLVKGPKISMKSFTFNDIKIEIDLSGFQHGEYLYRIKPSDIILPSGISLIRVEPQDVRITIDKVGKKQVKVVPSFVGELKDGYKIVSVNINPQTVTIFGTNKKIRLLENVETLPINLSDASRSFKQKIGIKVTDVISDAKPQEVEVEVKIAENIIEKTFFNIPVLLERPWGGLRFRVLSKDRVDITVKGRSDKIISLDNLSIKANTTGITQKGIYNVPLKVLNLPGDVELLQVEPKSIKIEVTQ
ncbi:MAG: CdaR family protein [Calditerrivibrio sp.]|nr:CdaR family protein [Calditerrivibrio sp.]